jgi:cytochrome c
MIRTGLILVAITLALGPAHGQAADARLDTARGLAIAETHCARCHAVGPADVSPLPQAPAFRDLHDRFPVADLVSAVAQGASTGHPAMPRFQVATDEMLDLVAYVSSVQQPGQLTDETAGILAGRRIAAQNCGACHAVADGPSPSPSPEAPPFRLLYKRPGWGGVNQALEEGMIANFPHPLEEGAQPMHPPMPRIELGPDEIANLAAYLESLQPSHRAR